MWELNKVHDIGVQSLGDKENKKVVYNLLKSFTKDNLVHLCTISIFPLYSQCNTLVQWHEFHIPSKLCVHIEVFNYISNSLVEKMVDNLRLIFFTQISLLGKVLEFPYEN